MQHKFSSKKILIESDRSTSDGGLKYALFIGRWQPWHDGHTWLINQKLQEGSNVLIAVRDVALSEQNPFTAPEVCNRITDCFKEEIAEGRVRIIVIPDIESVCVGRNVGYNIEQYLPSAEIASISASVIRKELMGKGFFKDQKYASRDDGKTNTR